MTTDYQSQWHRNVAQRKAASLLAWCKIANRLCNYPDSNVHGGNMGPIWGRQDPGGPHIGPMNLAILVGKFWVHEFSQQPLYGAIFWVTPGYTYVYLTTHIRRSYIISLTSCDVSCRMSIVSSTNICYILNKENCISQVTVALGSINLCICKIDHSQIQLIFYMCFGNNSL